MEEVTKYKYFQNIQFYYINTNPLHTNRETKGRKIFYGTSFFILSVCIKVSFGQKDEANIWEILEDNKKDRRRRRQDFYSV